MVRRILLLLLIVATVAGCAGSQPAPDSSGITLAEALAQIDALPTPEGVDAGDFAQLKSSLAASLRASGQIKFTSALPPGDITEVSDLSVANGAVGEIDLHWTYVNRGDYDQNSEPNIADLTPLGVNLFKSTASPDWATKAVAADGDGNGEINISDITPLGSNLFNGVEGYVIEATTDIANEASWAQVDEVDFADGGFEAGSPFWKFTASVTKPTTLTSYRVKAVNGSEFGPPSNVATYDPGVPPVANSVSPTEGDEGFPVQFIVDTSGGGVPTDFSWDFGGGATPDTSTDESPTVTLGADGTYNASVTVSNSAGSDTVNFTLTVDPVTSVHIDDITPTTGEENTLVQFVPTITGNPDTYAWDFGGGATPGAALVESPTVTLKTPGVYTVTLTATDSGSGDSDVYSFDLTVTPNTQPPVIDDVNPKTGNTGASTQFTATLSGTPPDTYAWDFGGGATPNTSSEPSPTVDLGGVGSYPASLTVTNANGSDTFDFTLDVIDPGTPPVISQGSHSPQSGGAGETVTFSIVVTGGTPTTWEWDFTNPGGDPMLENPPYILNEENPTVTLRDAMMLGFIKVTVSNAAGSDSSTFPFSIVDM